MPSPVPIQSSQCVGGTAAAPGAGSNFVTTGSTVPKAGRYRIKGWYVLTGTQETAALNVRLKANNASLMDLPSGQTTGLNILSFEVFADLDGVNVVALGAVAAATGGSVYSGGLVLDRLT